VNKPDTALPLVRLDLLDTVLTKAQKSKLEELMGTTYEAKPFQRGNFQILTPGKGQEGASKLK
jgi:hypothetical protein